MKVLCEVFGLFDKRWKGRGGTPYIIRGAWGLGDDKRVGANMRPKGTGRAKRRKRSVQKGKEREIYERKRWKEGGRKAKTKPKKDGRRRRNKPKGDERRTEGRRKPNQRGMKGRWKEDENQTKRRWKEGGNQAKEGRKDDEN